MSVIDYGAVWVSNGTDNVTVHSRLYWATGSTASTGGGDAWIYANPGQDVNRAYARCGFTWSIINPGYSQDMYCDMKYRN